MSENRSPDDQKAERLDDDLRADINPYAAPATESTIPLVDIARPTEKTRAAWVYTAIGITLVGCIIFAFAQGSVGLLICFFLTRVTWIVLAARFSRKHTMSTAAKLFFMLILGLHLTVLMLELVAVTLFVVCLTAAMSTP